MRNNLFILFFATIGLFFYCCNNDSNGSRPQSTIDSLRASNDSLRNVLVFQILRGDSLYGKLRQRNVLIRLTKLKCNRYANIVKKNPTQSVFIVAWIDRSFQWVDEE